MVSVIKVGKLVIAFVLQYNLAQTKWDSLFKRSWYQAASTISAVMVQFPISIIIATYPAIACEC